VLSLPFVLAITGTASLDVTIKVALLFVIEEVVMLVPCARLIGSEPKVWVALLVFLMIHDVQLALLQFCINKVLTGLIQIIHTLLPPLVEAFFKQLTGFQQVRMYVQHQLVRETRYSLVIANQVISYMPLNLIRIMGHVLLERQGLLCKSELLHRQQQLA
jgi:hypothetical protein